MNILPMRMFGRRKILTDYDYIDESNLREAVGAAGAIHEQNRREIRYLFDYYCGDQPILYRQKTVRPDIVHNTVVNRAMEISAFKTSYLLSEPIVYISRKTGKEDSDDADNDDPITQNVNKLNDYMYLAGKQAKDKELADDFSICGVAYRFVYPVSDYVKGESSGAPFYIQTFDPNRTFVAYRNSSAKDSEPVFAVTYVEKKNVGRVYDVYTADFHYTMSGRTIKKEPNAIGMIPIIEWLNNEFRLGAFEPVLGLLDAANVLESNRIEATEQNVQSLTWFNDVDLDDEQKEALKTKPSAFVLTKSIKNATNPKIQNIVLNFHQADQQVLTNDIYKTILNIAGMPSTGDGNTSDSSNNGSTIVRNGWQHAEARAKDTAMLWERSDRRFLAAVLKICNVLDGFDLKPEDVVGKFTRRNYEDIMTKSTVLTTLLGANKVHPKTAYQVAGLVPDPDEAYKIGMEWYEKQKGEAEQIEKKSTVPTEQTAQGGDAA